MGRLNSIDEFWLEKSDILPIQHHTYTTEFK